MAQEIRQYEVSVPAGTTAAAPQLTNLAMPARVVRRVRIRIPRGPNGQLGFALASSGVPIIPWNTGAWLVADDETFTFDLDEQIDSGAWQLRAYNVGAYAHSVYLTFELDPPQRKGAGAGPMIPLPIYDAPGSALPPAGSGAGDGAQDDGAAGAGGQDGDLEPEPIEEPPAEPGPVLEPPDPADGYAIARVNAVAAVQASLGDTITTNPALPPAPGTVARIGYDAGKLAALAALELL